MKSWDRHLPQIQTDLNWNRFFMQFQKDIKLWLFGIFLLELFRSILIFVFRSKISDASDAWAVVAVLGNGFRYDCQIISYYVLLSSILSALCGFFDFTSLSDRVRNIIGSLFIIVTTFLSIVTIGYFKEYDDQFNFFVLELFYDDLRAILSTIWSEYNPILNLLLIVTISGLAVLIMKRFVRKSFFSGDAFKFPLFSKIIISLLIVFALIAGVRGSVGRWTVKRWNSAVTQDEFLNKTVLNPYLALRYAIKDHLRLSNIKGGNIYLPDQDVKKAAKYLFSADESLNDLDAYMMRSAGGSMNKPARHVFLIVMESCDGWSMLPKYDSLGIRNNLKQIARGGLFFQNFLPSSTRTMTSLCSIITGLADAGVMTDYQKSAQIPFPTSIAETFRRLGYRTRCFYGGYLSWHRIGAFVKAQGFKEIYGASHIGGSWLSKNTWGVDDEYLFDFVLNQVDYDQPSFNLILTTSAHPPYDIDLEKKGFPLNKIPENLVPYYDGTEDLKVYGHMWYADQCLGKFVAQAETKIEMPLFAMTGDHFSRKFLNSKPNFFEKSVVPLVLYGKEVLKDYVVPCGACGSHMDIGPTLIELVAPKGFGYYALGKNLLDVHRKEFLGVGLGKVIGADFIADVSQVPKIYALPGQRLPTQLPDLQELKHLHDVVHGVSWWRIMRGPSFTVQG